MGLFGPSKKERQMQAEIQRLQAINYDLTQRLNSLGYNDYAQVRQAIQNLQNQYNTQQQQFQNAMQQNEAVKQRLQAEINRLSEEREKADKQLKTSLNKLNKSKEIYKSVDYAIKTFFDHDPEFRDIRLDNSELNDLEEISPSVILKLHHMDVKSLNKAFRDNDKQIEKILRQYQGRYTTKANQAIYDLMVIALRAELQNVLYNLKYDKLDNGIQQVQDITKNILRLPHKVIRALLELLPSLLAKLNICLLTLLKSNITTM